jgi:hypothetical protein
VRVPFGAVRVATTEITMKPIKSALALLAASGLVLSQPALARSGSPSGDSEHLAGTPSAAWPAIIAILAVAIVAVVASGSNNDNNHPASP